LIFLAITTGLLIGDLKRPERFWRLILAPNWTSWLVWGGYILMAFGGVTSLWWLLGSPPTWLLLASILLGAAAAGYSAFLFAQAEGRDFWQSPLLLPHLLAQAVVAGAGVLMVATANGSLARGNLGVWLGAALTVHLLMILGEVAVPHTNRDSAQAARHITHTRRAIFWLLAVGLGVLAPLGLMALLGDSLLGEFSYRAEDYWRWPGSTCTNIYGLKRDRWFHSADPWVIKHDLSSISSSLRISETRRVGRLGRVRIHCLATQG
jgi:formate-dependent nitrite reductase membrane component NrfD